MKNDIKKKFIDILFEPDDDEEEIVEKKETEKPVRKQESTVNARDILYRKPEKSAFINLEEKKEKKQDIGVETVYGDYEFSSQISPIFGVIKENKPNFVTSTSVNESLVSKPDNSHLEIITSPIYGYAKQNDVQYNYNEYFEDTSEQELHELLDDDFQDDHTYDDFGDDEEINLFNYRED